MSYTVLLYYRYVNVPDPEAERAAQLRVCQEAGLKGRILLGAEGINGTVAGTEEGIRAYREYMDSHLLFGEIEYKIDSISAIPFPKLKVKVRDEIVTLGADVSVEQTATHISAEELNSMLADPDVVLFDARNNYESAIGRFRGAVTPDIDLFKDLPEALDQYEDLKDKKIVAYCTGGIRCEKASALMKQKGFKNVYQLDGGIIKYAQKYPDGAFEGECFVFDERMKTAFNDRPALLGVCLNCAAATNSYYNCANKSCNKLMLLCNDCRDIGVCSEVCEQTVGALSAAGTR